MLDQELEPTTPDPNVVSLAAFRQRLASEDDHPSPPFDPAAAAHRPRPPVRIKAIARHRMSEDRTIAAAKAAH